MAERVEVLLLDCDGVIRHWDRDQLHALASASGISGADLEAIAFDPELLTIAMTGAVTGEEWAARIGAAAALAHGCEAEALSAGWLELGWHIDEAVLAIARRVRAAGNRTAILSNATTRLEADLERAGVAAEVDVIISSARLGIAKPDPAVYVAAAEQLQAEPSAILFVDDQAHNVVAAREAGMHAEVYMGAAALVTLVERAGLL